MHFSIPDTQELKEDNGSTYVAYNIHINGVIHCTVRYKQLHSLHEQLKKMHNKLPSFPPKKLLPLTPAQVEERRSQLDKYIQIISQDSKIFNNEIFNGFLVNAQQETQNQNQEDVQLNIYLMNGQKVDITILSTLQTDDVLETVAAAINLPVEFVFYYALFLLRKENDEDFSIVRRMQDFESPYISLKAAKGPHKIVLRKSYWDPVYDDDLLEDRVAMNLLYVQTVNDVERGWVITSKETQKQLAALQARGSKREYLQFARTLKFYGYLQFKPCMCDFPEPNSLAVVNAGNRELIFRYQGSSNKIKEYSFKVTRTRCWRVTTTKASEDDKISCDGRRLELAFQYLISKDRLEWITVVSEQAILMSVCLQSMVEELLMKKNGGKMRRPQDRVRQGSWSYMKRDGSSHQISVSRSTSNDAIPNGSGPESVSNSKEFSVKKLTEKLSSVSTKSSVRSPTGAKSLTENHVFEGIGDEDL